MIKIAIAIVLNENNEVLLIRKRKPRTLPSGDVLAWSFPGGKPNDGESGYETAMRETLEETGHSIKVTEADKLGARTHPQDPNIFIEYWAGTLIEYTPSLFTAHEEIEEVAWVPIEKMDEVIKLVIFEGIRDYIEAKAGFRKG
jgi:8-oxo-dGTP pyrophosphatase MutT (NUDIX family)